MLIKGLITIVPNNDSPRSINLILARFPPKLLPGSGLLLLDELKGSYKKVKYCLENKFDPPAAMRSSNAPQGAMKSDPVVDFK